MEVVFKGGQIGPESFFVDVAQIGTSDEHG
jgi:hypothetical protein